jgi:16S rRNA (cytosine967-C5)-methyltransferase
MIVAGVLQGQTPDVALTQVNANLRASVMEAVFATLRAYGRGDFFLTQLLAKPLKEPGAPYVRALLLIALQRLETEPATAHTTVDQAVSAAAHLHGGRLKALVNGVLRNFLRQQATLAAASAADEVAHWQHPSWWIDVVRADHPQHWQAILAAGNQHPPMSLRPNNRRVTSADLRNRLHSVDIACDDGPYGALYLPQPCPVAQLPGFAEGDCSVQDAGAQAAAVLLDVSDGMRVLDACAAPGGKAAHLLEHARIDLLALDADFMRAERIRSNLKRLGLSAKVRVADARQLSQWWDGQPFERILADVPCSASGVVRRHPDAKWLRRESDIARFAQTQAAIVDTLWQTLAPGGKMLYATCSVFARENSRQLSQFLHRHRDAALVDPVLDLLPDDHHDGFFYALLAKH